MADQSKNAGNDGDIVKHYALQKIVDIKCNDDKKEFWYIDTHTSLPVHKVDTDRPIFKKNFITKPKSNVFSQLPADPIPPTYLGSSAQVFQILKSKGVRIRMTLFELYIDIADKIKAYFCEQDVLVITLNGKIHTCLGSIWHSIIKSAPDVDIVLIITGDSLDLVPKFFDQLNNIKSPEPKLILTPDLILVDPFEINDEFTKFIDRIQYYPFMCWTPLIAKPKGRTRGKEAFWSFENVENVGINPGVEISKTLSANSVKNTMKWHGFHSGHPIIQACTAAN